MDIAGEQNSEEAVFSVLFCFVLLARGEEMEGGGWEGMVY